MPKSFKGKTYYANNDYVNDWSELPISADNALRWGRSRKEGIVMVDLNDDHTDDCMSIG